ncbi:MAG: 2-hydroxyacid dehydrogenase [Phycisphaeraceae bacterium]
MKVAVFSTKPYDRQFLDAANARAGHELRYFEPRLTMETAALATGFPTVCVFVNDLLDAPLIERLATNGTRHLALRSAGFNHVNLRAAETHGLTVTRVPAYSPHAVAEHAVGLMLTLNRKLHRAYNRVREGNFALDGLLGFDFHGRSVGIVGTGKIGTALARIMHGFGCDLLAHDVAPNDTCRELGVRYVEMDELLQNSDVVTLHCPLTPQTHHLIDDDAIAKMKRGAMLINTSRGALIDSRAVIDGLKAERIGTLGMDVYEEEADLFFEDLSGRVIHDDVFARLLTFPNVVITGHQAFFTREAMEAIARTTLHNITQFERGESCENRVRAERVVS